MEVNQTQYYINTDLQLINSIGFKKEPKTWPRPPNIVRLAAVLKLKNKATGPLYLEHLEQGREWLIKKGINLDPLLSKLTSRQQQPKQQEGHIGPDNYFHVVLSERTLPQYLEKAQQYSTMTIMQNIMSGRSFRKKFTTKFLEQQLSEGPNKFPMWECESQKDRKNLYLTLVKGVVQKKKDCRNVAFELLREFRSLNGQLGQQNFWDLLSFQFEAYDDHVPKHINMTRMFVTSLKLIHQEFQKRLHGQDFERYLSKNYISRAEGRWPFEHGGFWAKVWLYYCLGQQKEVNDLLSSGERDYRDLGRLFNASEEALKSGKPMKEKYLSRYEVQDIFYQQFIFNVTGQARYSCEIMTDPKSLQLVLIVVRTLGVFYQNEKEKFEQVKEGVLRHYRDYVSDPQIMKNMLYLLSYDQIIKMGPNSLMASEDYLHFLIVLSSFPSVIDQTLLEPILTQKIVEFIVLLLSQSKTEYIYYIPLIPQKNIVGEVSSIILSSNALDTFNWRGLKQLLKQAQYSELVYATVEKFRAREKGELKAAKKIRELAEDQEKGFQYLVHLITSHYLNLSKYPKEEVEEAEDLGLAWSKEQGTPRVYQYLFNFLHSLRVILALLVKRNQETLKSFVSSCQYLTHDLDNPNSMMLRMLQLMGELNVLSVYFYFLRLVVKAMQIYASRVRDSERLQMMKRLVREQISTIEHLGDLNIETGSGQLNTLKEQIGVHVF